ncbi:MAG: peptide chain release factor N(5)-glutamine methyltransferase [Mycobacterium sp.]|nr:peptide chain release factor N(5)-glutamine methyltransferase [Mycobacterium sp.]
MPNRLRQVIDSAATVLAEAGIDSARTDAELLAAHLAGTERGRLAVIDLPDAGFFDRFQHAVQQRSQRIPLQHITGTAAFGPVRLQVGPGVFIPRPETESMLEWVLAQTLPDRPVIVDLCTGSGALAIALAAGRPDAEVIAVDDDPSALEYARRNLELTGFSTGVRLVQGDVTDPALLPELAGCVDVLVANPPYIPIGSELEPEVAEHDPVHALFGGADGMAVITPIVTLAAAWLKAGGTAAVEHDDTTSDATVETFSGAGVFREITAHRDLTERPRFVTARRTGGDFRGGVG